MFAEFNKKNVEKTTSAIRMCDYYNTHDIPDGKMFQVEGIRLIDGKYGKTALFTILADNNKVDLWAPKHISKVCEVMLNSAECVRGIVDGKCGITFREYSGADGVKHVTVDFVDVSVNDPDNLPF